MYIHSTGRAFLGAQLLDEEDYCAVRKEGKQMNCLSCNPDGYYCRLAGRLCDPVNDCPLARFQEKLAREKIPEKDQAILIAVYAGN